MKKEVKKRLKKNYKLIIGMVIGIIISGVGVYAATTLSSSDITYDNSKSGLTSTNLNGAIDELYEKVNSKPCKVIKGTGTQTSDEIKCGTEEFYVLYSSGESITVLTKYPIEAGAAVVESRGGLVLETVVSIENPSYAQNKACGNENFACAGIGFSSEYKKVLNKMGLSDSIEVVKPSLIDLNKAGCEFMLEPKYDQPSGSCDLPWLEKVVLTNRMQGPDTAVIVRDSGLSWLPTMNNSYLGGYEKLMVKIPTRQITM